MHGPENRSENGPEVKTFLGIELRKLPEVDGLRFFAISLVLLHHVYTDYNPFMLWQKKYGWVGVDIFFTLSGFLITFLLLKEHESKGRISLKQFWIRRALRLWPSWVLVLLFSLPVLFYFGRNNPQVILNLQKYIGYYFIHLANYANILIGGIHSTLAHYWSLALEEHFYVIWPPVLMAMLRWKKISWALLTSLLILPYLARVWHHTHAVAFDEGLRNFIHEATHTRIDSLAWGCGLAIYLKKMPKLNMKLEGVTLLASCAIFFFALHYFYELTVSPWQRSLSYTLISIATCLLIWIALKGDDRGLRRILRWPILAWAGMMSYGVYLVHPLINVLLYAIQKHLSIEIPMGILIFLMFLLPYGPAALMYYFLDRKIEKIKVRFRPMS